jgi:NTP pyrophosphatase (non-canonical NTP hydrolase)
MTLQKRLEHYNYDSIKISDMQKIVDDWIQNNGGYWEPLSMLAAITEELGETAREINDLEKIKKKKGTEEKKGLDIELGDLIFSIMCLANHYKIDLGHSLKLTMEKYLKRDLNRFTEGKS